MSDLAYSAKVLKRIGLLGVENPLKLAGAGLALAKWGTAFPAGVNAAAARFPHQIAVIDDAGEITWRELRDEINRVTHVIKDQGIQPGDAVALLARNHRYMVVSLVALMQVGAKILLLNTMASRSQLTDLAVREGAKLMLCDEEFLPVLSAEAWENRVLLTWVDSDDPGVPSLVEEAKKRPAGGHSKPARSGRIIIFTSGTTGLPKGAKREEPKDLKPLLAFFGSIPFMGNRRIVLSAPLFHSWGLLNFAFGLITVPTYILRRKFVPEQVLRDIDTYKADALVVVPLMMQRLIDADPEVIKTSDVSSLRITGSSGSALQGELALKFMDTFTDSIYNFYGATETGWVTIAGPEDLRAAPGTAGRVPWRTTVKILDHDGNEVPTGETGVIHVKNDMMFGGYTDGNNKSFAHGLMNTGDLGHFDAEGRMFVSGRDDDMIISGGENVFPRELEDKLIDHEAVQEVVVTGVDDAEWGQRLAAYVVLREGSEASEADLIEYARANCPRYAVPKAIMFLDELPRNPTGKVMKRNLPPIA
jgi:acyl-CoA synthetase (AMP-forming)/AMP-acid ligase II